MMDVMVVVECKNRLAQKCGGKVEEGCLSKAIPPLLVGRISSSRSYSGETARDARWSCTFVQR
jgi:hypothetical protein